MYGSTQARARTSHLCQSSSPTSALLSHSGCLLEIRPSGLLRPSLDFLGPPSKRPLSRAHNFSLLTQLHSRSKATTRRGTIRGEETKVEEASLDLNRPVDRPSAEPPRHVPTLAVQYHHHYHHPPPTIYYRLAQLGATTYTRPQTHPCRIAAPPQNNIISRPEACLCDSLITCLPVYHRQTKPKHTTTATSTNSYTLTIVLRRVKCSALVVEPDQHR
ncbi:hypothetical protein CDEST_01143 [Colletotrichum destructivum]|uniref:Uncharacterized protein n=1 Tax=Colletotrichum destructivum TaxID=34406 RepID=A0AAX4HYE6_9PEZI|nr:hypothetical protein CDEST_01143 [Colletotrichum destructivum]